LLAGLALLVVVFYLSRHGRSFRLVAFPAGVMVVLPAWAMLAQIWDFGAQGKWMLFGFGLALQLLQLWVVAEALFLWRKISNVPPAPL
jgi:carbon starvation protein